MTEQEQIITDDSNLRKWRIELPNLIDDLGLDPYERTLYVHYKRRCGANDGECFETVRTTASTTRMSIGKVVKGRRSLAKRGLITATEGAPDRKGKKGTPVKIHIVDIWRLNFIYFSVDKRKRPEVTDWIVKQLSDWVEGIIGAERSPGER